MTARQTVVGLGLVVLGAATALFGAPQAKKTPQDKKGITTQEFFQPTGDPPVTLSNGSLYAHSDNNWVSDSDGGQTIKPKGATSNNGTLQKGCEITDRFGHEFFAGLWAPEYPPETMEIRPGGTVKIKHASVLAGRQDPSITIKVPQAGGSPGQNLTIKTAYGKFGAEAGDEKHSRTHSRLGPVEQIDLYDPADTGLSYPYFSWKPANPKDPHFTLQFCYK
jgi:hypothetical protein